MKKFRLPNDMLTIQDCSLTVGENHLNSDVNRHRMLL